MEENWIIFSDVGIEFSLPLLEEIGHKKKVRDPSLESEEYVIISPLHIHFHGFSNSNSRQSVCNSINSVNMCF